MAIPRFVLAVLPGSGLIGLSANRQPTGDELVKSSVFTPANGFTSGVEGPAVDKSGTLYVVNFRRQGTIGQVCLLPITRNITS